jgi:hypothetical protein
MSTATTEQKAQLVLRAQCHDREALESLLRRVMPALRRYLLRLPRPFFSTLLLGRLLFGLEILQQPHLRSDSDFSDHLLPVRAYPQISFLRAAGKSPTRSGWPPAVDARNRLGFPAASMS